MKTILGILVSLLSSTTFAGSGWIASGGDLVKDAHNPWWINSQKLIHYCIRFDETSVSTTRAKAEIAVQKVFNNWLEEWRHHFTEKIILGDPLSLGNQYLIYQSQCEEQTTDLEFIFGWNQLTDKQKQYLEKQDNYKGRLGVAVRTHYDPVTLRGKGFIYIASDKGPHKFQATDELEVQPWRHNFYLSIILAHEIGHTFGVRHSDRFGGLMLENFAEHFLTKVNSDLIEESLKEIYYFKYFTRGDSFVGFVGNDVHSEAKKLFKIKDSALIFLDPDRKKPNHMKMSIVGFEMSDPDSGQTPIEEKEEEIQESNKSEEETEKQDYEIQYTQVSEKFELSGSITAYLDKKQSIVPLSEENFRVYLYLENVRTASGTATNTTTGKKYPVVLTENGETLDMHFFDGKKHVYVPLWNSIFAPILISSSTTIEKKEKMGVFLRKRANLKKNQLR